MSRRQAAIGMCFDRTFPAGLVTDVARRLEAGGAAELWIIEDCFYTGGISLASAALTVTERLTVGLGILPAVARNPAVTAMEIATLCAMAPGRVLPGIGHGVQAWMAQMGARTPSPLTTLEEVISAVTRLLAGETVSAQGREVRLEAVRPDQPPADPPPVLAGVQGPRSLELAGRVAGGVVLSDPASVSHVEQALDLAGHPDPFHVVTFSTFHVDRDRQEARRFMAPWLAGHLTGPSPTPTLTAVPFFDEMVARHADRGLDGLVSMPDDWWADIAPIGTIDDALAHLAALEAAGVHSVALFPSPDVAVTMAQLEHVVALAAS